MTVPPPSNSAPPGNTVPGPVRRWVVGARPRTLWAAVVPVAVGTSIGWWSRGAGEPRLWWRALGALVVGLAIQVGTNYANDYSDGVRGTDRVRVGPLRLVGSGLASPGAVRAAALGAFGVAGVVGLALAAVTSWWVLAVGAACFAAGWLYTGGPKPYGYLGLGELFVFVFFGLVATAGSAYLQTTQVSSVSVAAAVPVGFLAVALLEANNLRDVTGDTASGKRTLAVRLGRSRAGWLYAGSLLGATGGVAWLATWRPWALLALAGLATGVGPARMALGPGEGPALLPLLRATGRLQLVVGVLLVVGILV